MLLSQPPQQPEALALLLSQPPQQPEPLASPVVPASPVGAAAPEVFAADLSQCPQSPLLLCAAIALKKPIVRSAVQPSFTIAARRSPRGPSLAANHERQAFSPAAVEGQPQSRSGATRPATHFIIEWIGDLVAVTVCSALAFALSQPPQQSSPAWARPAVASPNAASRASVVRNVRIVDGSLGGVMRGKRGWYQTGGRPTPHR